MPIISVWILILFIVYGFCFFAFLFVCLFCHTPFLLSLTLLINSNWDYSCVRELFFWRCYMWPRPLAHCPQLSSPGPSLLFCACAPACSGEKGRWKTFNDHWKNIKTTRVTFRMKTNSKKNNASETYCFALWTFALMASLDFSPVDVSRQGQESHMHYGHHEISLWPGTKWLCLAYASPCPRAVHDVMETLLSPTEYCIPSIRI